MKNCVILAELLCGRRPQKWSPILILRGMLVIFYGHGKRNGSRARAPYIHTYVRTSHFMTFLHEANFHPAYCQWHGKLDVSFAFFFLTFHVNRSIYHLLNFNVNDILRKICQKSRDEGEEKGIENNNGKG